MCHYNNCVCYDNSDNHHSKLVNETFSLSPERVNDFGLSVCSNCRQMSCSVALLNLFRCLHRFASTNMKSESSVMVPYKVTSVF